MSVSTDENLRQVINNLEKGGGKSYIKKIGSPSVTVL